MINEREETIRWVMNYCQHYDPNAILMVGGEEPTGICKAGVNYVETFGSSPGIFQRIPCTSGGEKTKDELCEMCPKWLQSTRQQGESRADRNEASEKRMALIFPVIGKWRRGWSKKNRVGKEEVIECPACKGELHLSQAAYNGHVWGKCETDGCVNWME